MKKGSGYRSAGPVDTRHAAVAAPATLFSAENP